MKKNKWLTATIDNIESKVLYSIINSKTRSTKKQRLNSWIAGSLQKEELLSTDDMLPLWDT